MNPFNPFINMSNLEQNKRSLQVKTRALGRILKELASYQQELGQFDPAAVAANKKQQ